MRGVCVDSVNNPPDAASLLDANLDSIRVEMRDDPRFYEYTESLGAMIQQAWLVGPSTGDVTAIINKSRVVPRLIIIGNEPDSDGNSLSGWSMSVPDYVKLCISVLSDLNHANWYDVKTSLAGMYDVGYLRKVMDYRMARNYMDYCNIHYPTDVDIIKKFHSASTLRPIVGEWCYRTAGSEKDMCEWESELEYYTWHSFWFCWSDGMVPEMGLVNTPQYDYLKGCLTRDS